MAQALFDSCEGVATALSDWDLEFCALEDGGAEIWGSEYGTAAINWAGFQGRVHQLGSTPADHYTIGIVTKPDYRLQWNGCEVDSRNVEVFSTGDEFDSTGPGGFGALTISVDERYLDGLAIKLRLPPLHELTGGNHWIGQPAPAQLNQLKQLLVNHLHVADPERSDQPMEDTLSSLLQTLAGSAPTRTKATQRWRVFRRAQRIMRDMTPGEQTTIADVCSSVDCSISTLERAFREQVGVGPKAYLLRLRFNAVNRALRESDGAGVTDIANLYGFWHMGKFAADYRKLFGELPSQTMLS